MLCSSLGILGGQLREELLLRERCGHASIPIDLEGEVISTGLEPLGEFDALLEVKTSESRGFAGVRLGNNEAGVLFLVTNGVMLSNRYHSGAPGFVGILEVGSLPKNVSQSDFVQSDRLDRVIRTAFGHYRKLVRTAAAKINADELALDAHRYGFLREYVFSRIEDLESPGSLAPDFQELALWPTTAGVGLSTRALRDLAASGSHIYYSKEAFGGRKMDDAEYVVLISDARERRALEKLFPKQVRNAEPRLRRLIQSERNRTRWMRRTAVARLSSAECPHPVPIDIQVGAKSLRGEVGIGMSGFPGVTVRFLIDGRLFEERTFSNFPIPFVRIVLEAPFTPTSMHDELRRDALHSTAILTALDQLPEAMSKHVEGQVGGQLPSYLGERIMEFLSWWGGSLLTDSLVEFGYAAKTAAKRVQRYRRDNPRPEIPYAVAHAKVIPGMAASDPDAIGLGGPFSLADLDAIHRERGSICVAEGPFYTEDRVFDVPVIAATEAVNRLIATHFGGTATQDLTGEVTKHRQLRQLMRQPKVELDIFGAVHSIPIEDDGIEGVLALMSGASGPHGELELRLCRNQRELGRTTIKVPCGHFKAIVNADALPIEEISRLLRYELGRKTVRAATDAIARLVDELAAPDLAVRHRSTLRAAIGALFPTVWHRQAYDRNLLRHSHEVAFKRHSRFLRQLLHEGDDAVRKLKNLVKRSGADADPDAMNLGYTPINRVVLLQYFGLFVDSASNEWNPETFLEDILRLRPALAAAPFFEDCDGSPVAPEEVVRRRAKLGFVKYTTDRSLRDHAPEAVLLLDPADVELLERWIGANDMTDATAELLQSKKKREFAARPTVDAIEVHIDALARLEIDAGPIRGEIAVVDRAFTAQTPSYVRLHLQRRFVNTTSALSDLPIAGALDSPRFALNAAGNAVDEAHFAFPMVEEEVRRSIPELVSALCGQLGGLSEIQRARAEHFLLIYYARFRPGGDKKARARHNRAIERTKSALRFRSSDGGTFNVHDMLQRKSQLGWISGAPARPRRSLFDPNRTILVLDPSSADLLRARFPSIAAYDAEWERENEALDRMDTLPALPPDPPSDALETRNVELGDMQGWLWIPKEAPDTGRQRVQLGVASRSIDRTAVSMLLPCAGAIQGDAVMPDEEWKSASLTEAGMRSLISRSVDLYHRLAGRLREHDLPEPQISVAREWLRRATDRLHAVFHDKEDPRLAVERIDGLFQSDVRRFEVTRPQAAMLLEELRRLPLYRGPHGFESLDDRVRKQRVQEVAEARRALEQRLAQEAKDTVPAGVDPIQTPEPEPTTEQHSNSPVEELASAESDPEPEPPPPPSPEDFLVGAVRAELERHLGEKHGTLITRRLERMRLGRTPDAVIALASGTGNVSLNEDHVLVRLGLRDPENRVAITMLAIEVFQALAIDDEDLSSYDVDRLLTSVAAQWARDEGVE